MSTKEQEFPWDRETLEHHYKQQCLKTEAAHQKRRELEETLIEIQGTAQYLNTKHEALINEHKSLLELCYKLIKACKVAFFAIDELKTSGDEQDWKAFNTFHRPHQVLLIALEAVNKRWPQ